MASVASIASTSNSSNGVQNSSLGQKDGSNKSTIKSTGNPKMNDRGRKESPVDTGRRTQQKVWTSGTNSITQRNTASTQANGNSPQTKAPNSSKTAAQKETGLSDKHAHDRLRFIFAAAVGLSVVFTTKKGERFEGIFAGSMTANNNTKVTLKMTRKAQNNGNQINGVGAREAALVGASPEHAMNFDLKDMADLSIPDFNIPEVSRHVNGANASFQTDSDISGNAMRGQRTLQKWEPDGPEGFDMSLESNSAGQWDQFETHKTMFGDKSTYHENLYTTEIDRRAPGYKQREAEAARIAREIEGSTSTNAHVREERGQTDEQDYDDEESKYSGVRREESSIQALSIGGPNKYTPPARRAPTATPTITGAPFDSAIISAQISSSDAPSTMPATPPQDAPEKPSAESDSANEGDVMKTTQNSSNISETSNRPKVINTSISTPTQQSNTNPSEDVENKVLDQFRLFANAERARVAERKRAQASQDRTAKLNDLFRFHKTFKLKTPIPNDLIGILAKHPEKQEAIVKKAQKDSEDAKTVPASAAVSTSTSTVPSAPSTSAGGAKTPTVPKFDASQIPPPIPDRQTFNKGRGAYAHGTGRTERALPQGTQAGGRTGPAPTPRTGVPERKNQVPAPIPLSDGRPPPVGPAADQTGIVSPHRSNLSISSSSMATKMNANAVEFRPTAPAFKPAASSNAPSSPASIQRTSSVSRAASPSSFFGARKPKNVSERLSICANFNPVKRLQEGHEARKAGEKSDEPVKKYAANGGIPNAYHTTPVWVVKTENQEKSYLSAFERPGPSSSPAQSRTTSNQHLPYQAQLPSASNSSIPQVSTPQHGPHAPHIYGHQFEEPRMHMQGASPQVYASPAMATRQMSNFSSPMPQQTQIAYGQQYYGNPNNQMPMPVRPYINNGGMPAQGGQMTAPTMVQQASSGPYMTVPQGYNQMPMYSPSPAHVYPQNNGYPSPGRAPMMMHQGSQQGHHGAQPIMYAMPGQAGPMMYGQQGQIGIMRGGYGAPQGPYGSSPHQAHHLQQRAMSSGYGQKAMQQPMQQNSGPPSNAPQQPAAYAQMEMGSEDNK